LDAEQLLDLWDAIENRRAATAAVANAADEQARREAESALETADSRVTQLQSSLWDSYPQPFVRCRDIGHVWDVKAESLTDNGYLVRELQCYRCQTTRRDEVNRYGELINRAYVHPADYIVKGGGGGRFGKPFWRGLTYMVVARR
jgi:hypothetical protein